MKCPHCNKEVFSTGHDVNDLYEQEPCGICGGTGAIKGEIIEEGQKRAAVAICPKCKPRIQDSPACQEPCETCGGTGEPCKSCGEYHPTVSSCPPHEVRMKWQKDICPDCQEPAEKPQSELPCPDPEGCKHFKAEIDLRDRLDVAEARLHKDRLKLLGRIGELTLEIKQLEAKLKQQADIASGLEKFLAKATQEIKHLEQVNSSSAEIVKQQAEQIENKKDALVKIQNWAKAYPLEVFPEPDFKKVAEVLKAAGISLDTVSASNMRHVINGVKKIVEQALKE
jgi:hypothetical protein